MGIYNRDYFRDETPSPWGGGAGGTWAVWQRVLSLTIVAFILQLLIPSFTQWLQLAPEAVLQSGQVWRLLTYAFLHSPSEIFHIIFNMLLLFFFGRRLESMYGGREFAWLYCTAAVFSGAVFVAFGLYFRDLTPVIGASGAVMALVILYALHFPREKVYLWGLIAIEMRWLATIIVVIDLMPVLTQLAGNQVTNDHVAHTAHLGGALFGWLYYSRQWRLSHWASSFGERFSRSSSRPGSQPSLKIYREEPEENLEQEVDRILQKLQDHGEASLTDKERQTLIKASERYKNRQKK